MNLFIFIQMLFTLVFLWWTLPLLCLTLDLLQDLLMLYSERNKFNIVTIGVLREVESHNILQDNIIMLFHG